MKLRFLFYAAILLLALPAAAALAQKTNSPLPPPTGYVNDYAHVIDASTKQDLETTLGNLDRLHQIQFTVVTVDTTGGQEIFDYSLAVARGWGVGSKDTQKPSLLLLVAVKDRKYFTQVSRHLEGDLPDGLVGQIEREQLVPAFRAGDYGGGLRDTIREYITTLASKNGFSTDNIFVQSSTPERATRGVGAKSIWPALIIFGVFIVIVLLIARRGGGSRFGGGGGGSSWLTWMLLNSALNSGRSSSSGWSSGGFGGSSGGSFGGGGFGGFGGGGDFGGGGAGGSW
jgi:uncharacterized protein